MRSLPPQTRALLCIAIAWQVATAWAAPTEPLAEQFTMRVWETDDGLPHNAITALMQRSDGFIWISTHGGLVRFDGLEFVPTRSPLLADTKAATVRAVIEENLHALAILSDKSGLLRLIGDRMEPHPAMAEVAPDRKFQGLFREGPDRFWIAFIDRGVWRWNQGVLEKFPPPDGPPIAWNVSFALDSHGRVYVARGDGIECHADGALVPLAGAPAQPTTIGSSARGGIWGATAGALYRQTGDAMAMLADPAPWAAGAAAPTALLEGRDGALWSAVAGYGLWRWTPEAVSAVQPVHAKIVGMLEDNEGNVWIGTAGGGLGRLQPARFTLITEESGGTTDYVGSVCEDAAGDVWYANRTYLRRIRRGRVEILDPHAGWPRLAVPIAADRAGRVWIAVGPRLYLARAGSDTPPTLVATESTSSIRAIYPARDGRVWIGRETGPVECWRDGRWEFFGVEQGYTGAKAQAFGEDATGALWIGTGDGDLFQLSERRLVAQGAGNGLPESAIRAIHGDTAGTLWIGTGGGGLWVRHGGATSVIASDRGLTDDVISQILEDDLGALWFGTRRGIFKIPKTDLLAVAAGRAPAVSPVVFGRAEGLSGVSAIGSYQPTAAKTADGRLWFATRKGLVTTDPARHAAARHGPRVYLERFSVDGQAVTGPRIRLSSTARRLEFRFTAPTFVAPESVRFRHRLEGFEADWSDSGTLRSATYSALPPGAYRFRVAACNAGQIWSEADATVEFEVRPMWWETWWARLAAWVAAGVGLTALVRFWSHRRLRWRLNRLKQKQRLAQERSRIARDLHDDLGASLTYVGMLADELTAERDAPATVQAQSARLAARVRTIARELDAVVWTVSPQHDNLASLCAYLCQHALEYFRQTPIRCHVRHADGIPPQPLSPEVRHHLFMIAKELMNNVVKHSGATQVELAIQAGAGEFTFVVADNGRGFSVDTAATAGRHGLENLRARSAECGGTLEFRSSAQGTAATLRLPLPPPEHPNGRLRSDPV